MNNELQQIATSLTCSFEPDAIAFALSTAYNGRAHRNNGEGKKTLKKVATLFARVIGHSLPAEIKTDQPFQYHYHASHNVNETDSDVRVLVELWNKLHPELFSMVDRNGSIQEMIHTIARVTKCATVDYGANQLTITCNTKTPFVRVNA